MQKKFFGVLMIAMLYLSFFDSVYGSQLTADDASLAPGRRQARQVVQEKTVWITTDHHQHASLKKRFTSGPEVTRTCLGCHNLAGLQFHQTIHWTWMDPATAESARLGKGGLSVNNFCINIQSNEPRCTSCHAGYGWKDASFDFSKTENIDCLVCHEQTGTYKKFPAGAGYPATKPTVFSGNNKEYLPPDWNAVAQSVGRPTRKNCGVCHFFGGGGDGVKHGDLDSSLFKPSKKLDVHMGLDGQDFQCVRCHSTKLHHIAGRVYTTPAAKERRSLIEDDLASKITCESCHSSTPHRSGEKPNDHTDKVACQSCHIPAFARVNPTKMWWDWSKAGKTKEGRSYAENGPYNKPVYMTKKGEFKWDINVKPEYRWFNGSILHLTVKDIIDPAGVVAVNKPVGDLNDPNSRIFPFKIHRGKQPYDKVNKNLVIPHLFGKKETNPYWKIYDWEKSIAHGMATAGLPFSGEVGFVETTYVYPTTHMVAPKADAVRCGECHVRDNGRLENLAGFYMPGRDVWKPVDFVGWLLVIGSIVGVFLHGLARFISLAGVKEDKS